MFIFLCDESCRCAFVPLYPVVTVPVPSVQLSSLSRTLVFSSHTRDISFHHAKCVHYFVPCRSTDCTSLAASLSVKLSSPEHRTPQRLSRLIVAMRGCSDFWLLEHHFLHPQSTFDLEVMLSHPGSSSSFPGRETDSELTQNSLPPLSLFSPAPKPYLTHQACGTHI